MLRRDAEEDVAHLGTGGSGGQPKLLLEALPPRGVVVVLGSLFRGDLVGIEW